LAVGDWPKGGLQFTICSQNQPERERLMGALEGISGGRCVLQTANCELQTFLPRLLLANSQLPIANRGVGALAVLVLDFPAGGLYSYLLSPTTCTRAS
jgi:hypothetical protein